MTYSKVCPPDGLSGAQIEQMQKTGLLTGNRMGWLMTFSMLPFLGYLLYIEKISATRQST